MTYFNAEKLGEPRREFVLWLDCMGTQCFMQRSIRTAANFIFKFQNTVATHCASVSGMKVYPVMDGVYITAQHSKDILSVATKIMMDLATLFSNETNKSFRFLVRGAISYGDVYHGKNVTKDAFVPNGQSTDNVRIRKESVLLGTPVIQAYKRENFAPPFGIALHSSCKLDPKRNPKLNCEWFAWCTGESAAIIPALEKAVDEYFKHYYEQTAFSGYTKEKIESHEKAFKQYMHLCKELNSNH